MCPLTTTAMLDAKAMLGKAGSQVELLGVDANPAAISLEDVWSYSELHGMLHAWRFLTGSLPELKQVWERYGIEAAIEAGEITHTPALFVIDPAGRLSRLYVTQMSYTAVPQFGQLLAQSAAAVLPGRPSVHADLSYARIQPTAPTEHATMPRVGGGTVEVGPGNSARLYVFFATWDQETSGLAGELDALNRYQAIASRMGLPRLTAVDEASVEPSSGTLASFLQRLPHPLSYPVALDRSGKIADGYEVLGVPWFVLTSRTGQLLYYREVLDRRLAEHERSAPLLSEPRSPVPRSRAGAAAVNHDLAGSPPPLAALRPAVKSAAAGWRVPSAGRPWSALPAGLSDRDQRLGIVVRAVPFGVRFVRLGLCPVRAAGRVPRGRHRRCRRRRAHVPRPAPGQLSQLPDDHQRPDITGRDRRPPHDQSSSTQPAKSHTCTRGNTTPKGHSTKTSAPTPDKTRLESRPALQAPGFGGE